MLLHFISAPKISFCFWWCGSVFRWIPLSPQESPATASRVYPKGTVNQVHDKASCRTNDERREKNSNGKSQWSKFKKQSNFQAAYSNDDKEVYLLLTSSLLAVQKPAHAGVTFEFAPVLGLTDDEKSTDWEYCEISISTLFKDNFTASPDRWYLVFVRIISHGSKNSFP